jgi:hypothetical protein
MGRLRAILSRTRRRAATGDATPRHRIADVLHEDAVATLDATTDNCWPKARGRSRSPRPLIPSPTGKHWRRAPASSPRGAGSTKPRRCAKPTCASGGRERGPRSSPTRDGFSPPPQPTRAACSPATAPKLQRGTAKLRRGRCPPRCSTGSPGGGDQAKAETGGVSGRHKAVPLEAWLAGPRSPPSGAAATGGRGHHRSRRRSRGPTDVPQGEGTMQSEGLYEPGSGGRFRGRFTNRTGGPIAGRAFPDKFRFL